MKAMRSPPKKERTQAMARRSARKVKRVQVKVERTAPPQRMNEGPQP
jgi:hypothetical protein